MTCATTILTRTGWLHLDGPGIVLPELGGVERNLLRALRNLAGWALLSNGATGN